MLILDVNGLAVNGALPLYIVSKSALYKLHSARMCLLLAFCAFLGNWLPLGPHWANPAADAFWRVANGAALTGAWCASCF